MKIYDKEPESQRELGEFMPIIVSEPFNWRAYNNSQTREKIVFLNLLSELCSLIESDAYIGKGRRYSMPAGNMIFCMCMKVFTNLSGRRMISELELCKNKKFVNSVPHFNSIFNYFECKNIKKHLNYLIELSALPLAQIETKFAIDSTGFSERKYMERWSSARQHYSMHQQYRKAHCIHGTYSNIIPHVIITKGTEADSPRFIELLQNTADNFNVQRIVADMAYNSRENFQFAEDLGITPFIPFKKNAVGKAKGAPAWNKAFKYFRTDNEEYMKNYHIRSNAESGFFMIKERFGDSLMMKGDTAQDNEIRCKVLCHNICVLAQEIYLSNLDINFRACANLMVAHKKD